MNSKATSHTGKAWMIVASGPQCLGPDNHNELHPPETAHPGVGHWLVGLGGVYGEKRRCQGRRRPTHRASYHQDDERAGQKAGDQQPNGEDQHCRPAASMSAWKPVNEPAQSVMLQLPVPALGR